MILYTFCFNLVALGTSHGQQHYYFYVKINTVIEYTFYVILFRHIINPGIVHKWVMIAYSVVIAYLIGSTFYTSNDSYSAVDSAITSLLLIISCILYLFQQINDPTTHFVYATSTFWIVVALIVYTAGTFFPFIFSQNYMEEDSFVKDYDLIHDSLYIVKKAFFCIAMFMGKSTKK